MMSFMRTISRVTVTPITRGLLVSMLVAGTVACSGIEPRPVDLADDCRDCPPGLFSGEDGVITIYP